MDATKWLQVFLWKREVLPEKYHRHGQMPEIQNINKQWALLVLVGRAHCFKVVQGSFKRLLF